MMLLLMVMMMIASGAACNIGVVVGWVGANVYLINVQLVSGQGRCRPTQWLKLVVG